MSNEVPDISDVILRSLVTLIFSMIKTIGVLSLAVAASATNIGAQAQAGLRGGKSTRQDIEYLFEEWRREFNMEFESAEEHINRLNVFAANHVRIQEHNQSGASYTMAHNKFSHLTAEEFKAQNIRGFSPETAENKGTKHEFDLSALMRWIGPRRVL